MSKFLPLKNKIRKMELAQHFTRNVSIVESHDPVKLMINIAFTNAKNALPLAGELKVHSRKYPMTKEQNAVLVKVRSTVSTLNRFVKTMVRKPTAENIGEALMFYDYIQRHLKGFSKVNANEQIGLFSKMTEGLEQDEALIQAAQALGLTLTVEKLKELKMEYETVYKTRLKALAKKEKARTVEISTELNILLSQLYSSIELAEIEHPELDYKPLINELNQEIQLLNASRKPRTDTKETDNTAISTPESVNIDPAV